MKYFETIFFQKRKSLILILIIAVIITLFSYYFFIFKKEEKILSLPSGPVITFPQQLGAGKVGEVMVKEEETGREIPLVSATLPPAIFSTTGIITEIKENSLIVSGSGTNFADGLPRDLTLIITFETITFNKNQSLSWKGNEGLKHLKAGMKILIGSDENIRGKTDFRVKTINIID